MIARRCCLWDSDGRDSLGVRIASFTPWGSKSRRDSSQELSHIASYKSESSSSASTGHGLDSIRQGCRSLRRLNLSPEAVKLLADIESSADSLTQHVQNTCVAVVPMIWPNPTPQEELDWNRTRPGGGKLIHTQLCIVAAGSSAEEWFMGQLFVSERGIAVEGSSGIFKGNQEVAPSVGLLPWESIEGVENDDTVVNISLKEGIRGYQILRLQVGAPAEADKMRKAWTYYCIDINLQFLSFTSISYDDCNESKERFDTVGSLDCSHSNSHSLRNKPGRSFLQKADAPITSTFLEASKQLPGQEHVQPSKPLASGKLTGVTLAKIRENIQKDDDWFLCRFQREVVEAYDLIATPWTQGQVLAGTSVRRLCFKFEAPSDVPKGLANMIGFPEIIDSTIVARLHCTSDDITLFMHSCSLNVPYGDYQRLEDILNFTANDEGGVTVKRYLGIKWVKSLPWKLMPVKAFLESKVKSEGLRIFGDMLKIMQKELTK